MLYVLPMLVLTPLDFLQFSVRDKLSLLLTVVFLFIVVSSLLVFILWLGIFYHKDRLLHLLFLPTDVILGIFYSVQRILLEYFGVAQLLLSMNSALRNFCCFQWLRSLSWWSSLFGEAFVSKVSTALNSFTTLSSFCSTSVSISDIRRSRFILMRAEINGLSTSRNLVLTKRLFLASLWGRFFEALDSIC